VYLQAANGDWYHASFAGQCRRARFSQRAEFPQTTRLAVQLRGERRPLLIVGNHRCEVESLVASEAPAPAQLDSADLERGARFRHGPFGR
jgi:hypothetical protein